MQSFIKADTHCKSLGKRLCSREELRNRHCCEEECPQNQNGELTWTNSICSEDKTHNSPFAIEGRGRGLKVCACVDVCLLLECFFH